MKPIKTICISRDTVNDEEVLIVSIPFSEGDFVHKGETILEYETSKALTSIEVEEEGHIAYRCKEMENVRVGSVVAALFDIWDVKAVSEWRASVDEAPPADNQNQPDLTRVAVTQYSTRAQALIDAHGLSKDLFVGRDYVSVKDVEPFIGKRLAQEPPLACANVVRDAVGVGARGGAERIVVVGANQISAEVIQDIVSSHGNQTIVGYVVDEQYRAQADLPYLAANIFDFPELFDRARYDGVVLAMGGSAHSMRFRKKIFEHYRSHGVPFTNVISGTAHISSHVAMGCGNVIGGHVYIGTRSVIGDNNFISYGAVIGHHNVVGSHNLFAPGVTMAGLVEIGDDCILPTGVNFIDRVKIGNRVVLPLGYNVVSELRDDAIIKFKSAHT